MRIGISLAEPRSGSLEELTATLQQAHDDGFSSAWLADIFGFDAQTALAYAGSRVTGIEVGTAVTPTYLRHPVALARQAITTDIATGGRFALGIGLSHKVVIEGMLHLSFDKPARHMREYLSVLVPLLREGKVSFSGETLGADATIGVRPIGPLPVLLAALAPQMLQLAGAVGDGTVLWMTGPRAIADHVVPRLTDAAADAGRSSPRVVCLLPVCVTDDEAAARARAAKVFSIYDTLPSYKAMLDKEGVAGPGDVAIVGDEAAVGQQIEALADIGVTDFVAGEFATGEDAARTRALLHDLTTVSGR
jgi:5,10-methylenetetrahydromethanopterin reductase